MTEGGPGPESVAPPLGSRGGLSLRSRVGLLSALGVGMVTLLIAIAGYVTVRAATLHQVDANLLERAHAAANGSVEPADFASVPPAALGAADVRIGMIRSNGRTYFAPGSDTAPPFGTPELEVAEGVRAESVRTATAGGQTYRVVAVAMPAPYDNIAFVLAQDTADTERVLGLLGLVLGAVGLVGMLLAAWAGFTIARTGLRPIEQLTDAAEYVARTGDLRPIPVRGDDELARLAYAFNAMLSALAAARVRERRLVADAGHELRTPLTSLRTNLDLLAQSEGRPGLSPEDRKALLDDVSAQVVELSALVGDLVELARDDPPSAARIPLDLAEVAARALERVRRRAPNVRFDVQLEPWAVVGDPQSLDRALTNVLDNAAKWSPAGTVVTVRLTDGTFTVADHGPGIAEADLPHVFERFYRSAEARTMPGSGLGLAIVKQAVDRHAGTIEVGRTPGGGTTFTIRIPSAR